MLLPENPEKRAGLWDSLATQLAHDAMCFVIEDGVGNPFAEAKKPTSDVVELVLSKLRAAQICRISANRGKAISPHFAGTREDDTVSLTELLTYPSEGAVTVGGEKLKHDLETVVINLLFADGGLSTVLVPLQLTPWAMRDAEISLGQKGLLFRKKL
jgi:hypothetical protein